MVVFKRSVETTDTDTGNKTVSVNIMLARGYEYTSATTCELNIPRAMGNLLYV
jgi:hypothetical protein